MTANAEEDLLKSIVAFRLGRWDYSDRVADFEDVADFISKDPLTTAVAVYDANRRSVLSLNDYENRIKKNSDFWTVEKAKWGSDNRVANMCSYLDMENMSAKFVMSLTDGALWAFNEEHAIGYPILQFARHRNDSGAVLFPLDFKYMGAGSSNLPRSLDDLDIDYDDKKDAVVWRGRLSGIARRNGGCSYAEKLIPSLLSSRSEDEFAGIISNNLHFPRILLCHLYGGDADFDVGLTGPGAFFYDESLTCLKWATAQKLIAPRMTVREQLTFRYILCLAGNDFASGFYWALRSNSIVLATEPEWLTPLDFGIEPWKHYVPIANDLSDIREKVEWCRENRHSVESINRRAKGYCDLLCNVKLRDESDRRVISAYENLVRKSPRINKISFASDRFLSDPGLLPSFIGPDT